VTSALLALDLDLFKQVNDTLGHPAGDEVLRQVAARLSGCVREVDLVARIGGDEFAILQHGASQPEAAKALAERLVAAVCAPYQVDGQSIVIGASVGVALITCGNITADDHMRRADKALYLAKAEGRGRIAVFDELPVAIPQEG
jgi:diguanylate cyclase (GGDEF)-like protein